MKEEIHDEHSDEASEDKYASLVKIPCDKSHDSEEKKCPDDSSFYKLLDIPAFGDVFIFFDIFDIVDESIGWSALGKTCSKRLFFKSFNTGDHAFIMPFGRSTSENDSFYPFSIF